MVTEQELSLTNESIKPSIEIGAFEALWAQKEISSFKQLWEKLASSNKYNLSDLVEYNCAVKFYKETINRLHTAGIDKFGVKVTGTIDYPEGLKDADYPLALLYYMGNWDLVFSKGVSVVGTRKPSPDGVKRTIRLVKELVKANFTIFSGLAAGVDAIAHKTAIDEGGLTVAVVGTPLWLKYPKENSDLYEKISKDFLLISQVPIVSYQQKNINFNRIYFPERNKTMSALSKATIIVEASETSGTLTQANAALKQGRKVFILNNNFENPNLSWPHRLEKKGAIRVRETEDILQSL
ncbi:TPA: DNA-processing protein DprA [Legionella pneumophila]|nr:DNA-processing protein DprA [Legionella pneumophila]